QGIIIRTFEEMLFGIWIVAKQCSMFDQSWAKIRTSPSREQQLAFWHLWILIADHLEFHIRCNPVQRHWSMFTKVGRSESAEFFTAIADEIHRTLGFRPACQSMSKFDHRGGSRSVVVRSVENRITINRFPDS